MFDLIVNSNCMLIVSHDVVGACVEAGCEVALVLMNRTHRYAAVYVPLQFLHQLRVFGEKLLHQ